VTSPPRAPRCGESRATHRSSTHGTPRFAAQERRAPRRPDRGIEERTIGNGERDHRRSFCADEPDALGAIDGLEEAISTRPTRSSKTGATR
jgi:hypothetical protein